jgi:hypothetical protein
MDVSIEIGATLTALIGATAAAVGLFQYRKAEAWKRAEFTGRLFEQLASDDELAFACRSLDWGVGPLITPQKYRVLLSGTKSDTAVVDHNWSDLANAMKKGINIDVIQNPNQLIYRYSFDAFCEYLDRLRIFVELGLVELSDLTPLGYYAKLMLNPPYYQGALPKAEVFGNFILAYYPKLQGFLCKLELLWNFAPEKPSAIGGQTSSR